MLYHVPVAGQHQRWAVWAARLEVCPACSAAGRSWGLPSALITRFLPEIQDVSEYRLLKLSASCYSDLGMEIGGPCAHPATLSLAE